MFVRDDDREGLLGHPDGAHDEDENALVDLDLFPVGAMSLGPLKKA